MHLYIEEGSTMYTQSCRQCPEHCQPYHRPVEYHHTVPHRPSRVVVIKSDQDPIKGLAYALGARLFYTATVLSAGFTIAASPMLIVPGCQLIPIALAINTYWLGSQGVNCAKDALYHLGASKNVVVRG